MKNIAYNKELIFMYLLRGNTPSGVQWWTKKGWD